MQIRTGIRPGPRKILLYGVEGVGKSTWANEAPGTIFLNLEDGLEDIDCARTPPLGTLNEVLSALGWVASAGYKNIAVDTCDWLEKLINKEVASAAGKPTVGDIAYGKGYELTAKKWDFLLGELNNLFAKGMGIILLAHSRKVKVNEPGLPTYEQYEPDLHASASPMIREWCQDVLFANYKTFTRTEDQGFGRERSIAVGGKERYIQTVRTAGAVAKNRVQGMPEEIPMRFAEYAKYVRAAYATRPTPPAENISGVVVDGSSKGVA
jgi:hypothetical protein